MVNYPSLISSEHMHMASPFPSTDQSAHSKQSHQSHNKTKKAASNSPPLPPCNRPHSAAIDVLILIAVLAASGVLLFPYAKLFCHGVAEIGLVTLSVVKDEVGREPIVYAFLGVSFFLAVIAVWGVFQLMDRKCDNPSCRGLRKAAEFDIQIETEECLKNPTSADKADADKGFFELSAAHHTELEAELKKMAPPNGKAVLVFRARCGCAAGRMEVWGPRKARKIKK